MEFTASITYLKQITNTLYKVSNTCLLQTQNGGDVIFTALSLDHSLVIRARLAQYSEKTSNPGNEELVLDLSVIERVLQRIPLLTEESGTRVIVRILRCLDNSTSEQHNKLVLTTQLDGFSLHASSSITSRMERMEMEISDVHKLEDLNIFKLKDKLLVQTSLKTKVFKDALSLLEMIDNRCTFKVIDNKLICETQEGEWTSTISFDSPVHIKGVDVQQTSVYDIRLINNILNSELMDNIDLYFSTNIPLFIYFPNYQTLAKPNVTIEAIIAPRVEDED